MGGGGRGAGWNREGVKVEWDGVGGGGGRDVKWVEGDGVGGGEGGRDGGGLGLG